MRLLIATFVALVVSAGAALPAGAAEIKLVGPRGGETKSISFGSLESQFDVDANYVIRNGSGTKITQHVRGISLARLLESVDADPVYGGVEVVRPSGSPVRLSKLQLLASGPTPVIYASSDQLVFLRPSYGSRDANGVDIISAAGALTLKQVDLGALDVKITPSKRKVKAGELVTFTGSAEGGGAGESYEFEWDFNDGKRAEGASVSHRFKKRGEFTVLLTAKPVGSDRSSPTTVKIVVGNPVKSKKNRSGGGDNDASGAPVSGASDGDSGTGEQAATEQAQSKTKRKKKPAQSPDDSALERVTGQVLLSSTTEPVTESSTLAARSGTLKPIEPESAGLSISTGVWASIAAILILAFGAALENGKIKLRPSAG
ncbi:MAG: PKD domain-containing protein [Solirubrobacterales bacterium]